MSNIDPYTTPSSRRPGDPPPNTHVVPPVNSLTGYERPYPQHYTESRPTNGMAIASLVLGIVWAFWIGSALAIVFGHTALNQIKAKDQEGKGMAVAGLVLGYVGAGTFVLFVVLPLLAAAGA